MIEVIDLLGKILVSETPQNVLNQTYQLPLPDGQRAFIFYALKQASGFLPREL